MLLYYTNKLLHYTHLHSFEASLEWWQIMTAIMGRTLLNNFIEVHPTGVSERGTPLDTQFGQHGLNKKTSKVKK
jgi:hypothetical protein